MPRSKPIDRRDVEIASRIKSVRVGWKCPRSYLASRAGVDSAAITRIELGRVALKYELARGILRFLNVSPLWAATGTGEPGPYVEMPPADVLGVAPVALFREVFQQRLKPLFVPKSSEERPVEADNPKPSPKVEGRHAAAQLLNAHIHDALGVIADAGVEPLFHRVVTAVNDSLGEFGKDDWETTLRRRTDFDALVARGQPGSEKLAGDKSSVDFLKELKDNPGVRLTWSNLKKRLHRATAERGGRARLARDLGVSDATINTWLVKDVEPGAEAAFRLLDWVTAEEAKTKSPGSALTPPEQMTPTKSNTYETQASGSKRRSQKKR